MEMTRAQKQTLFTDGYVRLPGVVPRMMVDKALQHINHSLGEGMDPAQMPIFRAQSYCRELQSSPVIVDLLYATPAWSLCESALGEGNILPVRGGQIALRFPTVADPPGVARPHLDGMYSPDNGVPEGTIKNFTALVGVLLSDVTTELAGNFTVWPGTHHQYEQYFREHGPETLLNGLPPIDMPKPIPLCGQAGDVFLVHYQLAHGISPNISPNVRYAIFFRLHHVRHSEDWKAPMQDIWLHWPGMSEIVQTPSA